MAISAADAIIRQLIEEERVVVSPWRALILLRRAAREIPRSDRGWPMPRTTADIAPILRQMRQRGDLALMEEHRGFFRLIVPEARNNWIDEQELLFELMPYGALSHRSAMILHGLSNLRTHDFVLTTARQRPDNLFPLGTMEGEWRGIRLPDTHHPACIMQQPLTVRTVTSDHFFGYIEDDRWGIPVRVTSVERTLVDGLIAPDLSDGIDSVLEAWGEAYDQLDLESLIAVVDRYDIGVLRQRVGYVLNQLGVDHPAFHGWRLQAQRGGTSRLVAAAPFAPTFDRNWNLSINAQTGALEEAA